MMQSEDPPRRLEDVWARNRPSRFERYLGCALFPIVIVVNVAHWLFDRLFKNPIGGGLVLCVLSLIERVSSPYYRLRRWLNPTNVRLTQDWIERGSFYFIRSSDNWYLFENAMESEVRLCAGNGRGEIPRELRGRGLLLRPGQQWKISFPPESYYDIEVYGRDGQRLERMKLIVSISLYDD